jgi:adenosylmethionine-8-amino-7-oxononanoate aminotransferase
LEASEEKILENLEKQLQAEGSAYCALIVEPLIQGARGMVMHRPQFLEKLVKLVRKFGILVIFDEVFTGFYRTGRFFAMDYVSEKPDIVCLSKALTGGFLPLSLTITTDEVYNAFLSNDPKKALIHGHSYTGNPIACAAACKSLEIFMRSETRQKVATIEQFYRSYTLEGVTKRRTCGLIDAFDVISPQIAKRLVRELFERGIFMRPLGSTLYILPPLCVMTEDLVWVYDGIQRALKSI